MKSYKFSKKIDFMLSMLPFLMVAVTILITILHNSMSIYTKYYLEVKEFFKSDSDIFFLTYKFIFVCIAFVAITIYLKLWNNRFYYIWLGFFGFFSTLFFLMKIFDPIKKWIKLNYIDNHVYSEHSFIKGLDAYSFISLILLVFLYLIFVRKIQLIHIIDLCYSAFFALSIIQIVYFLFDVPTYIFPPGREVLGIQFGAYCIGGLIISVLIVLSNRCNTKLIIWGSSFLILGLLLQFEDAFLHKASYPVDPYPGFWYLEHFLIRSDLIFFFVLFIIVCYIQNRKIKKEYQNSFPEKTEDPKAQ